MRKDVLPSLRGQVRRGCCLRGYTVKLEQEATHRDITLLHSSNIDIRRKGCAQDAGKQQDCCKEGFQRHDEFQ